MKKIVETSFNQHLSVTKKTKKKLQKTIISLACKIAHTVKTGGKIIWCGNGGSAADSLHLSSEFVGKFKKKRLPLPSTSLCSDIANLTCIANDYGFEYIFSRQLESIGKKNDLLICLTTSGNSKNIINCLKQAKKMRIKSVLFSGLTGGKSKKFSDLNLLVPSQVTARIQEMHVLMGQLLCELVEKKLKL
jgi:D-sedoheptulose 7-phosphate isomerase